ncbi:MAG TPA: ATP-binding protein [Nitrososphaeraceae archaeon]|jgi:signal transduction histidine kinase
MDLISKRIREIGIISIILIVAFSTSLLFYIQNITEQEIKSNLLSQQNQRQIASTKGISLHTGSDLNLVVGMLDGLANSLYLQQGDFYSNNASKLVGEKYTQFSKVIDKLFLLDKNNVVKLSFSPAGSEGAILGADYSQRNWVVDTRNILKPVFSNGFERQGMYTIFISYPIINRNNGEFLGIVATSIPTVPFFARYGNVEHIDRQFLVAYDANGTMLANGASQTLVGQNFFGNFTQQFIKHNPTLNNLTRILLAGGAGAAVYNYGKGERITTGSPIIVNGKPLYFVQVVTPTTQIYSDVNDLLSIENVKMFTLLGGTIAAVAFLIILLFKWTGSLNREVKRRTNQLDISNNQLALANEKLKIRDKMQEEFINVAAHELRTPIQPIIGLSEVLRYKKTEGEVQRNKILDVIIRNAKRLQTLSEDILDVTRIESNSLLLNKEKFNLNLLLMNAIADSKNYIANKSKDNDIKIESVFGKEEISIEADKNRINQVTLNLLINAIKFTRQGNITISAKKQEGLGNAGSDGHHDGVVVAIKDTGTGIDPAILPKLFTKFASSSDGGTGLGLFISKNIVEAHGGRIWAINNENGGGATFSFWLPVTG